MDEIDNDDYQHAFSEYQQAADLGDPIGQYDLGLVYEKGKNQEVNLDLAKDLYKQAAQKNIVKAMSSLGAIYALELNISKAVPWFNLAISFKDADAAYQMGWLAEKGLLPHGSMAQAIEYYQQAAAQGQANSILALARLYQSGVNIQQDLEKSAGYYAQLANDNYPEAQYELAKCCLSNSIKLCTAQEAKTWLIKAEHNGYKNAAQLLRLLQAQSQDNVSYIESIMVLRGDLLEIIIPIQMR